MPLPILDLDPDLTAAIMIHIAPRCVETIQTPDDADFLAAVAVGETLRAPPTPTRRRVADRLWQRACAYRATSAAMAALTAALILTAPAEAAQRARAANHVSAAQAEADRMAP
jgi:hypothetical protein